MRFFIHGKATLWHDSSFCSSRIQTFEVRASLEAETRGKGETKAKHKKDLLQHVKQ